MNPGKPVKVRNKLVLAETNGALPAESPIANAPKSRLRRITVAAIRQAYVTANAVGTTIGLRAGSRFKAMRLNGDLMFLALFVVDFPLILTVELLDLFDIFSEVQMLSGVAPAVYAALLKGMRVVAVAAFFLRKDYKAVLLVFLLLGMQTYQVHPFRHWVETRATSAVRTIFSVDTWRI